MEQDNKKTKFFNTVKSILIALIIALVFRYVLYQPFKIPSKSMLPNLLVGDHLIADRINYGFSIPCSSSFTIKPFKEIKRGDVIIFHWPGSPSSDSCPNGGFLGFFSIYYIKRVIGVPGDIIEIEGNDIYINGKNISYPTDKFFYDNDQKYKVIINIFDEKEIETIYVDNNNKPENFIKIKVPLNSYFVLGDNRDNSLDSRFWGFVDRNNIIGVPTIIHFSWDGDFKSPQDIIRFERFFKSIE